MKQHAKDTTGRFVAQALSGKRVSRTRQWVGQRHGVFDFRRSRVDRRDYGYAYVQYPRIFSPKETACLFWFMTSLIGDVVGKMIWAGALE